MLQPFTIRDLHTQIADPHQQTVASSEEGASQDTTAKNGLLETTYDVQRDGQSHHRHGVAILSASEYDHIISTHPRAALMYMDPDDGDIITVSSVSPTYV